MGFLSGLFGGNKQDKALKQAFEQIRRILEDEEFHPTQKRPMLRRLLGVWWGLRMETPSPS